MPPLTREDLENDVLRAHGEDARHHVATVPQAEFDASFERILENRNPADDLWIFGYGSLIWNPLVKYTEHRLATIHGFHRCFCMRSRHGRGTVEAPGLMLGLDFGGTCKGIAFRIAAADVRHELKLVWRREMVAGSYAPRWLAARTGVEPVKAIAFVVNHAHQYYTGKLPRETIIRTLATAHGKFGSGADYLYQTVDCLAKHGVRDIYLSRLREEVMKVTHGVHHPIPCPEIGA